jgi:hypothetical protein
VYLTLRDPALQDAATAALAGGVLGASASGSTVVLLGMVSFFTDVSSEMVTSVLPVYLTVAVGLSPLGLRARRRRAAGLLRVRAPRGRGPGGPAAALQAVAVAGYGLSALSRLLLVVAPAGAAAVTASWRSTGPARASGRRRVTR